MTSALGSGQRRVLLVSLSTYASPHNDGKLEAIGACVEALTAVAGNVATLWGETASSWNCAGYSVAILPMRFTQSYATTRLRGLDQLADALQPTVVHIECEPWQAVAVQALRVAKRLGIPAGVHFAEMGPRLDGAGGLFRRTRGSRVLRGCDYAVGWSRESTEIAQTLAPGVRTATFPATGIRCAQSRVVQPDRFFGAGSSALPKLAFVGRFSEEKGIRDFLVLCDELARERPIKVAIAGGLPDDDDTVRRWIDARPWALLHGVLSRSDVSVLLAAADVLVCPSRSTPSEKEQFGKAAVEAMGVGTPVFAYGSGALAEVIGSGGVIVPEGSQNELFAELGDFFAGSASQKSALSERAVKQASLFTDEVLAQRLITLWSEL